MFKQRLGNMCSLALCFYAASSCAVLHDPTKPLGSASGVSGDNGLHPGMMLFSKGRAMLWMNGRYMTIGDKFMNGVITDITPNNLVLNGSDGVIKIPLGGNIKR